MSVEVSPPVSSRVVVLMAVLAAALSFPTLGQPIPPPLRAYELNGTFLDTFGGPAMVPEGGTLGATSYAFGPNQGLTLENAGLTNPGTYSIEMGVTLDTLRGPSGSSWVQLVDFSNLASDAGLYSRNGSDPNAARLYFFPVGGTADVFSPGVFVHIVITRDASTNAVSAYALGLGQFTFTDSGNLGVFSAANNIMRFLQDDFATGQREATSGSIDFIRIYNTVLTAAQVAVLNQRALGSPNVPDGEQAGYTTSGSLEQVVDVSPGDECTVSLWVGKRSDGAGTWGRWYVQLTTGGWNIQNVMNGSLAAQGAEWAEYSTTFTVGSFPNLPLRLRIKGQWGFEVYDLVALDCGGGDVVSNGSFESPAIDDGTWTTFANPAPDDWTTIGGGAGLFNPNTTQMNDFF